MATLFLDWFGPSWSRLNTFAALQPYQSEAILVALALTKSHPGGLRRRFDAELVFVGQQIESDQTGEIEISRTNVVIRINHGGRSRRATSRAGHLDGRSFAE